MFMETFLKEPKPEEPKKLRERPTSARPAKRVERRREPVPAETEPQVVNPNGIFSIFFATKTIFLSYYR